MTRRTLLKLAAAAAAALIPTRTPAATPAGWGDAVDWDDSFDDLAANWRAARETAIPAGQYQYQVQQVISAKGGYDWGLAHAHAAWT